MIVIQSSRLGDSDHSTLELDRVRVRETLVLIYLFSDTGVRSGKILVRVPSDFRFNLINFDNLLNSGIELV